MAPKSAPAEITIHPGSGNFFLAEQRKDRTIFAFQQRNPNMAEKLVAAAKRGAQALMRLGYTDLSNTISATTGIIDSKRVTHAQRQVIIDEVAKCIHTSQCLARSRLGIRATIVAGTVAGGFGLGAWIWMTGGREVAMERVKAAAKSNS